jgi:dTDP-4-amino-4,6-dideoxygalactose transaminase
LVGINSRLDEVQAAILRVKLPRLESWHERRIANARAYDQAFAEAGLAGVVVTPVVAGNRRHVFNQYVIRVPANSRDALREHLAARGVGTEIYYPLPLHIQVGLRALNYRVGDFPESERAARETLALPIYPELTTAMIAAVVEHVAEFFKVWG